MQETVLSKREFGQGIFPYMMTNVMPVNVIDLPCLVDILGKLHFKG